MALTPACQLMGGGNPATQLANTPTSTASTETVSLQDLDSSLSSFENSDFNYIKKAFEYVNVNDQTIAQAFKRSAVAGATLKQVEQTLNVWKANGQQINSADDINFYARMANFALARMPDLMGEANQAMQQVNRVDPKQVSAADYPGVVKGTGMAKSNLNEVLASAGRVESILSGYQAINQQIATR